MILNRRTLLQAVASGTVLMHIPSAQLLAKSKTNTKHYVMVVDVRRCTSCLSCTVSCSIENKVPEGRARTAVPHVLAMTNKGCSTLAMPVLCNHCDNPPCVSVCPAKATWKREEDGIVVIDYNKCIHCMQCVPACPYGARKADTTHQNPPEKCNFCIHRVTEGLLPACVETCIGEARVFGDLNDPKSEVYRLVKTNKLYAMLKDANTKPNVLYIGLPDWIDDKAILSMDATQWQR